MHVAVRSGFARAARHVGKPRVAVGRFFAAMCRPPSDGTLLGVRADERYNVPESVRAMIGRDLIMQPAHPLGVLWNAIQDHFKAKSVSWHFFDRDPPVVRTQDCFDSLLVPPEHPSRSPSDTYYVNEDMVLRTHTSAHQCQYMRQFPEISSFLCAGEVFRRDEIDASHYPIFHQCEGVRLFSTGEASVKGVEADLKRELEGVAAHLFGLEPGGEMMRWNDDYFPFTEPSFELEIHYNGAWLEVLGCGVIHHDVLRNAGLDPEKVHGWAFGLGLERLAMVLFNIPDIRLFWSSDARFSEQFTRESFASRTVFKHFSKYPPVSKDISFWVPDEFVENDLFEAIREEGGDQVEKAELVDEFTHPKTNRTSKMFRVTWRDMTRTLTHEEVNRSHNQVLERIVRDLGVELR